MFFNTIQEYKELSMSNLIDYDKFYLYSIVTHSTAIDGSTMTEVENQVLLKRVAARGKSMEELNMNLKEEIKNYNLSLGDDSMEETVSQHMHR
mgnify:CR=1 FL=1